jgi:hemolysin activation/secretion protein
MASKRSALRACALGAIVFACVAAFSTMSAAAPPPPPPTPPPPSPQELNPVQRAPQPAKPHGNGDLLSAPEPGPCPLASSNLKFTLNDVTFNGAATLSAADLAPAYAEYVGREVPVSVLCEIRDRASTILFGKGLFARVEIPAQRISQGHVTFDVIEAYIASVRVRGDDSGAQAKVEDYIEMLRGMKPFNIQVAQRYLFLASDVPGVVIAATLRPAGKGRGAIELVITVTHKPFDAIANVQNFGSQATGPFGALARVDVNGFTPYGERSTLVIYQSFDLKEQRVFQGIEEARFGSDGLLGRVSLSFGETRPGDQLKAAFFFGQSWVIDGELSYPFIRSRAENLAFTGGLEAVDEKINSLGAPLSQDRLRVLFLRANGDRSWRGDIPLKIDGNVELRQGITLLDASHRGDQNLSRIHGRPDAFVLRGEARATAGLPAADLTGIVRLQGQYAGVPLLSYEQQSIGNLTIGRGYDPSALSGDRAVAASADLRWDPDFLPSDWPVTVSGFAFFDVARVWNLELGGVNKTVRSVGVGLTFQVVSRLHIETIYAHPMDKINNLAAQRAPDRVMISATVEY